MYCWPAFKTAEETALCKGRIVDGFLNDPAYAEAILALLQVFRDKGNHPNPTWISPTGLRHQSKALSLLCRKLDDPGSATEQMTLWTVIVHLVLNEATDDWVSFGTNLSGLRQMLIMHGGMAKVQTVDGRMYQIIRLLENVYFSYQQRMRSLSATPATSTTRSPPADTPSKTGEDVHSMDYWPYVYEPLVTQQLPEGILNLCRRGQVRRNVAIWLGRGFDWLRQHEISCSNGPGWEAPTFELLQSLQSPQISHEERCLCIALLVILSLAETSNGVRGRQQSDTLEAQIRGHIIRLNADHEESQYLSSSVPVEDYEVWTSLTIVSMYVNMLLACHNRLNLVLSCIARDKHNRLSNWSDIRNIASKFYITDSLEARWRFNWKVATNNGSLST